MMMPVVGVERHTKTVVWSYGFVYWNKISGFIVEGNKVTNKINGEVWQ